VSPAALHLRWGSSSLRLTVVNFDGRSQRTKPGSAAPPPRGCVSGDGGGEVSVGSVDVRLGPHGVQPPNAPRYGRAVLVPQAVSNSSALSVDTARRSADLGGRFGCCGRRLQSVRGGCQHIGERGAKLSDLSFELFDALL